MEARWWHTSPSFWWITINFLVINPPPHSSIRWNAFLKLRNTQVQAFQQLHWGCRGGEGPTSVWPHRDSFFPVLTHTGLRGPLASLFSSVYTLPLTTYSSHQVFTAPFLLPVTPGGTAWYFQRVLWPGMAWVWATQKNSVLLSQWVYPSWTLCLVVTLLGEWERKVRG